MQKKQGQDFSFPPLLLQNILNRNDKSEHITNLDNVVRIIITWSEWNYRIPRNQNNRNGIRVVGNQYFYYSLNSMLSGKVKLSLKKMYSLAFLLD